MRCHTSEHIRQQPPVAGNPAALTLKVCQETAPSHAPGSSPSWPPQGSGCRWRSEGGYATLGLERAVQQILGKEQPRSKARRAGPPSALYLPATLLVLQLQHPRRDGCKPSKIAEPFPEQQQRKAVTNMEPATQHGFN